MATSGNPNYNSKPPGAEVGYSHYPGGVLTTSGGKPERVFGAEGFTPGRANGPPDNIYTRVSGGMGDAQSAINNALAYRPTAFSEGAIQKYMNPFTNQVIGNTLDNLDTARQKAVAHGQTQAMNSGAFGGSRHGVSDNLLNESYLKSAGDLTSGLNMQNYNQALGQFNNQNQLGFQNAQNQLAGAGALGSLANLGFGMGQKLDAQEYQRSIADQMLQQGLANQASGMFGGFTNQGTQNLSALLSALGIAPGANTTTQTMNPGLFDYMTLLTSGVTGLAKAGVPVWPWGG